MDLDRIFIEDVSMEELRVALKKVMKGPLVAATRENLRKQPAGCKNFTLAYNEAFDALYPKMYELAMSSLKDGIVGEVNPPVFGVYSDPTS